MHLEEKVEPLKEHPVEAGEVEEVGEGEGGAEERLCELRGDQVLPGEGEDPVERGQPESAEQSHVDLVAQAAHLPGGGNNYPSCQVWFGEIFPREGKIIRRVRFCEISATHFHGSHVAQQKFNILPSQFFF